MLWSGRSDNKRTEAMPGRCTCTWPICLPRPDLLAPHLRSSAYPLHATFKHRHGRLLVIACYAPTNSHIDANKDSNSTTPSQTSIIASFARHDIVQYCRSLSATWTQPSDQTDAAMNPSSDRTHPGVEMTTVNGSLIDLCALHRLKITGSWFSRRRNMQRWTWISNDGRTKKELDYIIDSARWNIVQNCRVHRSADCGNNTDHRL